MKRIKVDYPLQDTLRYIASVKTALQRRERCREAYANAVACVTAVEESVKHHSSDKEVQAARAKSERLTADMKEAERELGQVTARLIPDLERVRREVATEIRWVLLAFTDIQVRLQKWLFFVHIGAGCVSRPGYCPEINLVDRIECRQISLHQKQY